MKRCLVYILFLLSMFGSLPVTQSIIIVDSTPPVLCSPEVSPSDTSTPGSWTLHPRGLISLAPFIFFSSGGDDFFFHRP